MNVRTALVAVGAATCVLGMISSSANAQETDRLPNGRYSLGARSPVTFYCDVLPENTVPENDECVGHFDGWSSIVYLTDYRGGGTFTGYWVMTVSSQDCGREIGGSRYWGTVAFTFDDDRESWTGLWGYCEETPRLTWNGQR